MHAKTQIVRSNIQGYMLRILLSYCIDGQFPEGWNSQDHEDYLQANRLSLFLAVFSFDGSSSSENLRQELQQDLFIRFSVCAKAYKSHIVCLAFVPSDYLESSSDSLHQQLNSLFAAKGISIKNARFALEPTIMALPASYRNLHAQAESVALDSQARFNRLIRLYALEEELNNRVFDLDADEMRRLLDDMTKIISVSNAENHLNSAAYFCFLWRSVERAIFYRIGRRKTSVDKLLIDEEIFACKDAVEMSGAVHRYLLSYARDVHLQNPDSYHKVIERTKDYIQEKYAENLSLERVAREAGVSACYLSKLFKKEEGINFKQYVIKIRMEKAKFLLGEGKLNIGEVARACGYSEAGYFCRVFKQYWGVLPKEFQMHT